MADTMINDNSFVCVDCYWDHHEGRAMKDQSVTWADNTYGEDESGDAEGVIDFSSSPCACCGTTLAGSRHRMAIFEL